MYWDLTNGLRQIRDIERPENSPEWLPRLSVNIGTETTAATIPFPFSLFPSFPFSLTPSL